MLILDENADGMAILRTRPATPLVVAGCLFAGLGLLPILPAGFTGLRLLTTLGLGSVAAMLVWLGRSRTTRLPLPVPAGRAARSSVASIALTGSDDPEVYRAELVLKDGTRRVVFERPEPAGVARDALRLARQLGVRVDPGWGLGAHTLSLLDGSTDFPPQHGLTRPVTSLAHPLRRQHIAAITTLWGGLFVLVVSLFMSLSPYRPLERPSSLSMLLPGLSVLIVVAVGLWLLGLRERLVFDARGVTQDFVLFGRALAPGKRFDGAISGLFPVAPNGGPTLHVLVARAGHPLAFHADAGTGRELARQIPELGATTGRAAE